MTTHSPYVHIYTQITSHTRWQVTLFMYICIRYMSGRTKPPQLVPGFTAHNFQYHNLKQFKTDKFSKNAFKVSGTKNLKIYTVHII